MFLLLLALGCFVAVGLADGLGVVGRRRGGDVVQRRVGSARFVRGWGGGREDERRAGCVFDEDGGGELERGRGLVCDPWSRVGGQLEGA